MNWRGRKRKRKTIKKRQSEGEFIIKGGRLMSSFTVIPLLLTPSYGLQIVLP